MWQELGFKMYAISFYYSNMEYLVIFIISNVLTVPYIYIYIYIHTHKVQVSVCMTVRSTLFSYTVAS
jgi:hypothetical protein